MLRLLLFAVVVPFLRPGLQLGSRSGCEVCLGTCSAQGILFWTGGVCCHVDFAHRVPSFSQACDCGPTLAGGSFWVSSLIEGCFSRLGSLFTTWCWTSMLPSSFQACDVVLLWLTGPSGYLLWPRVPCLDLVHASPPAVAVMVPILCPACTFGSLLAGASF